jgi:hypothetical protein
MIRILITMALLVCGVSAQTVYNLPFASSGNTIELTLANTGATVMTGMKVRVAEFPSWIRFTSLEQRIPLLKSQQETTTSFTFANDKTAPVQKTQILKFVVSTLAGESWTKEITVAVAPPEKFEVFQNFPNPFNPATSISYQLSTVSSVQLMIYNVLGQEVASLVDREQLPGYHLETWDATSNSSGMYIYQLIATDEKGQKQMVRKRMMFLK